MMTKVNGLALGRVFKNIKWFQNNTITSKTSGKQTFSNLITLYEMLECGNGGVHV